MVKMIKMVNFMLGEFYPNFKKSKLASVITLLLPLTQQPGQIWGPRPSEQFGAGWALEASPIERVGCPLAFPFATTRGCHPGQGSKGGSGAFRGPGAPGFASATFT